MAAAGQKVQLSGHFTPLRYPGGKGKLAAFVKQVLQQSNLLDGEYVEPYAGGAAIAIELLAEEYVSRIHINDISRPVWAFWKSVLDHTEELARLIRDTKLSVSSWDRQKRVFANQQDHDPVALGFAVFFLNRTNRSGILNGGIIGGRDQSGPWKIDARYNGAELIRRIESIARMRKRISLTRQDAALFLRRQAKTLPPKSLIYLDPPYYRKGKDLYYDYYTDADHRGIAQVVRAKLADMKWIVSYDNVKEIREMYAGYRRMIYSIGYSAREVRQGSEVMFFCDALAIPRPVGAMRLVRTSR
jgi:DNA adenine methylase